MAKPFVPLGYDFAAWISLPKEERVRFDKRFFDANREYIDTVLRDSEWVAILGTTGKIYSSSTASNFPSCSEIRAIAMETGEVPRVYTHPPVIEEHDPDWARKLARKAFDLPV